MITANKDTATVAGRNIDIIYELNHIIYTLLENNPEIGVGVISAWANILAEKTDNADKIILATVLGMSEDFIKLHIESESNNE